MIISPYMSYLICKKKYTLYLKQKTERINPNPLWLSQRFAVWLQASHIIFYS